MDEAGVLVTTMTMAQVTDVLSPESSPARVLSFYAQRQGNCPESEELPEVEEEKVRIS